MHKFIMHAAERRSGPQSVSLAQCKCEQRQPLLKPFQLVYPHISSFIILRISGHFSTVCKTAGISAKRPGLTSFRPPCMAVMWTWMQCSNSETFRKKQKTTRCTKEHHQCVLL